LDGEVYGVVVKPGSILAEKVAGRVIRTLERLEVGVAVEEGSARAYESLRDYPVFRLEDPPGRLVVVGGDGTLLRTVMRLGDPERTIIMAVRAGKKGFLLDVESYEVEERVEDFVNGDFRVVEYPRLLVQAPGHPQYCVMNDAVFVMDKAKLVRLSVYVDGERIMGIDGDGLVVSTTVGSTAYSLSAGGPIVDPNLDVTILTPLNPVQLYLRPVILPPQAAVEVEVKRSSNPAYLSLDGQETFLLNPGTMVRITRCPAKARIARFKWWENYYEKLYTRIFSYL